MNATRDALLRRLIVFAAASLGTFVLYLSVGELLGVSSGQPLEYATGVYLAQITAKAVAALSAGHGIALGILAFLMRGFSVPSLRRCAFCGLASATLLEVAYLSGTWLSEFTGRGIVRLGIASGLSILICAIRARRPSNEPELTPSARTAVAIDSV